MYRIATAPTTLRAKSQETAGQRLSLLVTTVVISIFLPEALGFFLFGFRFTITRFILLFSLPLLIFAFGEMLGSRRYHFALSDLIVPVLMIWMIVALGQTDGLESAVKTGGAAALDFGGCYLVTRCLLKTSNQVHSLVNLFCLLAGIAGLLSVLDVVFDYHVLREGLASITGYTFYDPSHLAEYDAYTRLGFLRAQGPFEQPVLLGVVMCYAVLLSRVADRKIQFFCWLSCGLGLFLSASSAPWEAMILGMALVCFGRLVHFPLRWLLLFIAATLIFSVFFLLMPNPFGWIFNHLTLDAASGYFRLMIWDAAGADVINSPVFGIGATNDWFRPDWMPSSVDSLWLRAAMLYGIPGSLLIAASILGAHSLPVRRTRLNSGRITDRDVILAESLGIVTFLTIYIGFTIYYWGSSWFLLGVLAGMRAFLGQLAAD